MRKPALAALALLCLSIPLSAKESLGIFSGWGAFKDPSVPRCYAIAEPQASRLSRDFEPFASVGTWPARRIRGQVHFRLARAIRPNSAVTLRIGGRNFSLAGGKADAWAKNAEMDAAILAAMRSAESMTIRATDKRGRRFSNSYLLAGAATAIDAATLACGRR